VWDAAEEFGPAFRSTEGESVGTSFVDATALGTRKLFVRLIIVAKNASGTEVEYGDVAARFDLED
jgi:hypothetical protein